MKRFSKQMRVSKVMEKGQEIVRKNIVLVVLVVSILTVCIIAIAHRDKKEGMKDKNEKTQKVGNKNEKTQKVGNKNEKTQKVGNNERLEKQMKDMEVKLTQNRSIIDNIVRGEKLPKVLLEGMIKAKKNSEEISRISKGLVEMIKEIPTQVKQATIRNQEINERRLGEKLEDMAEKLDNVEMNKKAIEKLHLQNMALANGLRITETNAKAIPKLQMQIKDLEYRLRGTEVNEKAIETLKMKITDLAKEIGMK